MNYIISKFQCELYGADRYVLYPNCKYNVTAMDSIPYFVCDDHGILHNIQSINMLSFAYGRDQYWILNPLSSGCCVVTIKFKNSIVNVTLGDRLHIAVDGDALLDTVLCNIEYSHYETRKDCLIIFFRGRRNYVVIIKNTELKIASFYDEINLADGEMIFMCRCYDMLGYGRVFLVNKNGEYDSYLVYLSRREIMDQRFVSFAMLDGIMMGNTKLANDLLSLDVRLDNDKDIIDFFPDFDDYVCIDEYTYALIKKNTLAGIYQLEFDANKISNIIQLD